MFRTLRRKFFQNPLERILQKAKKRGKKRFLFAWNRGLGDIALGLYAIVHRVRQYIPDAEVTFLIRENLEQGFKLLKGVNVLLAPTWKRGEPYHVGKTLEELGVEKSKFDLIIEKPSPTDWVSWQRGKLTPKLSWNRCYDDLHTSFGLDPNYTYIGVQMSAETEYGYWRNWPQKRWEELFLKLEEKKGVRVLLFGHKKTPYKGGGHIIDLRGETNLFQLLSIVKNRCKYMILPDSGILSMIYYLNVSFPIQILSLWADPFHGILKQNVPSPNPELLHYPIIGSHRDLSTVEVEDLWLPLWEKDLFSFLRGKKQDHIIDIWKELPLKEKKNLANQIEQIEKKKAPLAEKKPFTHFTPVREVAVKGNEQERELGEKPLLNGEVGVLLLAGGEGTRLGFSGPKGAFPILEGKTLFSVHMESLLQAEEKYSASFPVAIMCSKKNYEETLSFFVNEEFFGKKREDFFFFTQESLPIEEKDGKWIMEEGEIVEAPDGNGNALYSLKKSGALSFLEKKGVLYLVTAFIDNVLANPLDPYFIGAHLEAKADISIKCIERDVEEEKMGVLVYDEEKNISVVEYIDIPEEAKKEKTLEGHFLYRYGNTGIFCLSRDFVDKIAETSLPVHKIEKKWKGKEIVKYERFFFSIVEHTSAVYPLCYPKRECFAPLKTKKDIEYVQEVCKR